MSGLFKEAERQTRHRARPLGRGGHGLWTLHKGGVEGRPLGSRAGFPATLLLWPCEGRLE